MRTRLRVGAVVTDVLLTSVTTIPTGSYPQNKAILEGDRRYMKHDFSLGDKNASVVQTTTLRKRYVYTLPSGRQLIVIYEDDMVNDHSLPYK